MRLNTCCLYMDTLTTTTTQSLFPHVKPTCSMLTKQSYKKNRVHSLMVPATGYPRNTMWQEAWELGRVCDKGCQLDAPPPPTVLLAQSGRQGSSRKFGPVVCFFIGAARQGGNQLLERTKLEEKRCLGRGRWIYWDRHTAVCQKCPH